MCSQLAPYRLRKANKLAGELFSGEVDEKAMSGVGEGRQGRTRSYRIRPRYLVNWEPEERDV